MEEELKSQNLSNEIKEYKKFAFNQNLIGMAVALIVATSLQKLVTVISNSTLMPVVNYFVNKTNGNWKEFIWTPITGMNFEIGNLCGGILEFTITTLVLYVVYYKSMQFITKIKEDIKSF